MIGSGQVSPYGINVSKVMSKIAFPFYINGHNLCSYCANVRKSWYIVVYMHDGSMMVLKQNSIIGIQFTPYMLKSQKGQHWHFYNFKICIKQRVIYILMYVLT